MYGVEMVKLPLLVVSIVALRHARTTRAALYRTRVGGELVDEYVYGLGFVVGNLLADHLMSVRQAVWWLLLFGALYAGFKAAESFIGGWLPKDTAEAAAAEAASPGQGDLNRWFAVTLDFVRFLTAMLLWMLLRAVQLFLESSALSGQLFGVAFVRALLVVFVGAVVLQPRVAADQSNHFVGDLFGGLGFVLGRFLTNAAADPKTPPQLLVISTVALVVSVRVFGGLKRALKLPPGPTRRWTVGAIALIDLLEAAALWFHLSTVQLALQQVWLLRVNTFAEVVRVPLVLLAVLGIAARER